jgi:serine protease AprX
VVDDILTMAQEVFVVLKRLPGGPPLWRKNVYSSIIRYIYVIIVGVLFCAGSVSADSQLKWQEKVDRAVIEKIDGEELDFLVFFEEQADLSFAGTLKTKLDKGTFVFETLRDVAERTQPPVVAILEERGAEYRRFWAANMIWVRGDRELLETIAGRPEVARIHNNDKLAIEEPVESGPDTHGDDGDRSSSSAGIEWGVTTINAHLVWAEGVTGEGAVVAGIDTGYDWEHPALIKQYRGWNGTSADHGYSWHDAVHSGGQICPPNSQQPCDEETHGTHTMGTIVGDDGGSNQVGVAPGAKWIGCRCWERVNRTDIAYVTECLQWIIAPTDLLGHNPDPAKAPHVVNNSWICEPNEGCTDPNSLRTVVKNIRAGGTVVVASAGNDGPSCNTVTFPPAIYEDSFSVGATTRQDVVASFSSRGPVTSDGSGRRKPEICAPGDGVRSAFPGGVYASQSGTSMAGPHVAGVVALLISANPELAGNVDLIEQIIIETAVPLESDQMCGGVDGTIIPNNTYGYGRIDAYAAYERAMELATPAVVDFALKPSFPNPFFSSTQINYELAAAADVSIRIYDATGRQVRDLVNEDGQPPDRYEVSWNGRNDDGALVPAGVYFCKLDAGGVTRSNRMIFIR